MAFDHIDTWVFDLDNTLYNADTHSFPEMGRRMTGFVAELLKLPHAEADVVRKGYFKKYGTTLRGLMNEHGVPPTEFLRYVHDFDLAPIPACDITRKTLALMPGRKIVFTNAPLHFAERMLEHLGIASAFSGVFAVEEADYWPKPMDRTYDAFFKRHDIRGDRACMLEDMEVNLAPAHARGMTTVWLHGDGADAAHPHVHHKAPRLPDFFAHPYFSVSLRKGAA
jgi:putative hydrolase of the HAD superfamily